MTETVYVVYRVWLSNGDREAAEAWRDKATAKRRAEFLTNMAMDTRHPDTIPEYAHGAVTLDPQIRDPLWTAA